jgi:NADPH:quinone reductase-like Zn-dependent oxidoreductase
MRALFSTPGGPSPVELRETGEPTPAADEALVRVEAASLNRGELALLPRRPNWRPGQDIAGVVAWAAAAGGPPEGARVAAIVDQGGWAELVAAPVERIATIPDGVGTAAAATLGVAGLTALRALQAAGSLLGARVLVTGASGGVGRFAVQLARVAGAEVTASAGGPERAAGLEEIGAARVVTEGEDLGGPFDAVMEGVGGASLERSVRALAQHGVVMLYGAVGGEPARLGLSDFASHRGGRVQSFFIYATDVSTFGRDLGFLAGLVGDGRLRPQVGLEVSWRDLGAGIAALRERRVNGKVVLRID